MSASDLTPIVAGLVAAGVAIINGFLVLRVVFKRHAHKAEAVATVRAEGHGWAEAYEAAISQFGQHVRPAHDGTLQLDLKPGDNTGIDPVFFADLSRSLAETNRKILRGEISRDQVYIATT
jgi:hypothetical protein